MPSPSFDLSGDRPLAGQLVVFTGKLTLLGRRDARALVSRLGGESSDDVNGRTTLLVVGAEGFGHPADVAASAPDKSNKLRRAEELNAQKRAVIRIVAEDEFCTMVGLPSSGALKKQYYAVRDLLARYRALREDHVRYLIKYGVIGPILRTNADTYFAFQDVAVIKQANDELDAGASFRSVLRSLVASRQGQLAFDFRIDAAPARIVSLRARPSQQEGPPSFAPPAGQRATAMAEEYFRAASQLDDDDNRRDEAATLYRKALELDPYLAAALINLANIHYGRDELAEAQALYERAIGLEAEFFEAHFNLGNIYHDLGQFADAQACYREALRLNPTYPDAHFYLAVTLEKMGLSNDARPHWRAYQNLAPHGEWVQLAKEFSD